MTPTLQDVLDEYLHWRKVNPHIKGGENYLKRLHEALAADPWNYDMDAAPKDGTKLWLMVGKQAFIGNWYKHPSVSGWVADEIDCADFEFEPTAWMIATAAMQGVK